MSKPDEDVLADELIRLAIALFDAEERVKAIGQRQPALRVGAQKAEAFLAAAKVAVFRMSDHADNAAFVAGVRNAKEAMQ